MGVFIAEQERTAYDKNDAASCQNKHFEKQAGRNEEPSYALIDSQSVKTTCYGENHGYDGEKTKGRKRYIVTDTMGNLLCIHVHAANIHDTKGGVYTFEKDFLSVSPFSGCDGGYRGTFRNTFDEFHNIRIDISMQIKEQKERIFTKTLGC